MRYIIFCCCLFSLLLFGCQSGYQDQETIAKAKEEFDGIFPFNDEDRVEERDVSENEEDPFINDFRPVQNDFEWGMVEAERNWILHVNDVAEDWVSQGRFCEATGLAELLLERGEMDIPLRLAEEIQDRGGGTRVFRTMIEMAEEQWIEFDPRFEGPLSKNYGMLLVEAVKRLGRSGVKSDQEMVIRILENSEHPLFIYLDGWECQVLIADLEGIPFMAPASRDTAIKRAKQEWERILQEVPLDDLLLLIYEPCDGSNADNTTTMLEEILGIKVPKPTPA